MWVVFWQVGSNQLQVMLVFILAFVLLNVTYSTYVTYNNSTSKHSNASLTVFIIEYFFIN